MNRLSLFLVVLISMLLIVPMSVLAEPHLILLEPESAEWDSVIASLEANRARPLHLFPQHTIIVDMDTSLVPVLESSFSTIQHITTGEASTVPSDRTQAIAVTIWNERVVSPSSTASGVETYDGGVFTEDVPSAAYDPEAGYQNTSLYLIGKVAVGVMLIEQDISPWLPSEEENILGEVYEGLSWLQNVTPHSRASWYYDIHYHVPVSVAPTASGSFITWGPEVREHLGYSSGGTYDYLNDLRSEFKTDWAYILYINRGSAINGYAGFASVGGPYAAESGNVINPGGWESKQYGIAHETAHVFGAGDMYCNVGGSCCWCSNIYGFLEIPNWQCEAACEGYSHGCLSCNSDPCLMKLQMVACESFRHMVGWRDTDSDGSFDPVDDCPGVAGEPIFGCPLQQEELVLETVFVPEVLLAGTQNTLHATFWNVGSENASNVEIRVFINGSIAGSATADLAANTTQTVPVSFDPGMIGEVTLSVQVVPLPGETNTGNNEKSFLLESYPFTEMVTITHDEGIDTDTLSGFDVLSFPTVLNITEPGTYVVEGDLWYNDTPVTSVSSTATFSEGIHTYAFNISSFPLARGAYNGSFLLDSYRITTETGTVLDTYEAYTTNTYTSAQFDPVSFLTGGYQDVGLDLNNNSRYEYLIIPVQVTITEEGNYSLQSMIRISTLGQSIVATQWLTPGIHWINHSITGPSIYQQATDGPYEVLSSQLRLYHEGSFVLLGSNTTTYNTAAYAYTDFENESLPSCATQNGTLCSAGESCDGTVIPAQETGVCCEGTCFVCNILIDPNCDYCVDGGELGQAIQGWFDNMLPLSEMVAALYLWKYGSCTP